MQLTAFRRDARVPTDHCDTTLHRTLKSGNQRICVVGRNCNRVDLLGDQAVNDFDLTFSCCVSWTCVNDFNIAEFFCGFFRAFCSSFKEANAKSFDNQRNAHVICCERWRSDHCGGHCSGCCQFLQYTHGFLPGVVVIRLAVAPPPLSAQSPKVLRSVLHPPSPAWPQYGHRFCRR